MERILVAEDEKHILLLLTRSLQKWGYDVVGVEDGQAALEHLAMDSMFNLLITDIKMPKVDGLELLTTVKREYPHLPVMVISAYQDQGKQAVQLGADGWMTKPFDARHLIDNLRNFFA